MGEQRIQEFAKFFQLNPNPVARISAEGEVLLCNEAAAVPSQLRKRLDILPNHALDLVQRLDDGENELSSTLKMGEVGTKYGRVPGKSYAHLYAVDVPCRSAISRG